MSRTAICRPVPGLVSNLTPFTTKPEPLHGRAFCMSEPVPVNLYLSVPRDHDTTPLNQHVILGSGRRRVTESRGPQRIYATAATGNGSSAGGKVVWNFDFGPC